MKRLLEKKAQSFGALGQAALDLARAEGQALSGELKGSGKVLTGSIVLILLGLFTLFWALGVLAFFAVELLATQYPRWVAALVVFGFLLLLAAALAAFGWARIKRIEKPAATVRRHWLEYREWWSGRWIGDRRAHREEIGSEPQDGVH